MSCVCVFEIGGKVDKSNTDDSFRNNIFFFIQVRSSSDKIFLGYFLYSR